MVLTLILALWGKMEDSLKNKIRYPISYTDRILYTPERKTRRSQPTLSMSHCVTSQKSLPVLDNVLILHTKSYYVSACTEWPCPFSAGSGAITCFVAGVLNPP
jgi:hypothetical protein